MKGITNELIGAASSSMIMAVLKEGDCYGYDIITRIREITDGKLRWKESAIYPILKKLESLNMIKSYWMIKDGERPRKYYHLQDKGLEQLYENKEEWLIAQNIFKRMWNK